MSAALFFGIVLATFSAEAQFNARGRRRGPDTARTPPSLTPARPKPERIAVPDPGKKPGASAATSANEQKTKGSCDELQSKGDIDGAKKACEEELRAARTAGERVSVLLLRSRLEETLGHPDAAERDLERALVLARGSGFHAAVLEELVRRARTRGAIEPFLAKYRGEFRSNEEKFSLAKLEREGGSIERALVALEKARAAEEPLREALRYEAELRFELGQADRALELLAGYLERHPEDLETWSVLLREAAARGKLARHLARALPWVRRSADVRELSDWIDVAEELADAEFLRAVEGRLTSLSEHDDEALLLRIERDLSREKTDVGEELVRRSEGGRFRSAAEKQKVGSLLLDHGLADLGLEWLRKGVEPTRLETSRNLALGLERASLLLEKKRSVLLADAEKIWRALAFSEPRATAMLRTEARRHLVTVKQSERRLPEELAFAERELSRKGVTEESYLYAAELFGVVAEPARARRVLEQGSLRFPSSVALLEARLALEEREGNYEEALVTLGRLLPLDGSKVDQLKTKRLDLLEKKGDFALALAGAQKLLEESPGELRVKLTVARLKEKAGDRDGAFEVYSRAIEERGAEPELVRKAVAMAHRGKDVEKLLPWIDAALARAKRSEEATPLLEVALGSSLLEETAKAALLMRLLTKFPEAKDVRILGLEFYRRKSFISDERARTRIFEGAEGWLLSLVAKNDRGSEKQEALAILARVPPQGHADLLLEFLRKSTEPDLQVVAVRLLEHQTAAPEARLLEIAFDARTARMVRHAILALLVSRRAHLEDSAIASMLSSEDAVVACYGHLLANHEKGARFRGKPPKLQLVADFAALSGFSDPAANGAFTTSRSLEVLSRLGRISPDEKDESGLSLLVFGTTEERGAVRLVLAGVSRGEVLERVRKRVLERPSNLAEILREELARGNELAPAAALLARYEPKLERVLREALERGEPSEEHALDFLEATLHPETESFGRKLGDSLVPSLAGIVEVESRAALRLVAILPFEGEAFVSVGRSALLFGGARASVVRSRILENPSDSRVSLLTDVLHADRSWVELRRDLEALSVLYGKVSPEVQAAITASIQEFSHATDPIVREQAQRLLERDRRPGP